MARASSEVDVVVWGATGYTGRLVVDVLRDRCAAGSAVRWALAGRSRERLEAVHRDAGLPEQVPIRVADASDARTLASLVARAGLVLTTVGPYQLHGNELLEACVTAGTDYVDLCGEPAWMHRMIGAHSDAARRSGARIVFSCGFDSVPFDLGVYFLQQQAMKRRGRIFARVKGRVRSLRGTFSGGTVASFKATIAAATGDPGVRAVLMDPFSLTPGFRGPAQPSGAKPEFDAALGSWVGPFVMAGINTRNVHRTNFLLGFPYGQDFAYDEMMMAGPGAEGEQRAIAMAKDQSIARNPRLPGEGPSKAEREAGSYELWFLGEDEDGERLRAIVRGEGDPGYASTSRMIVETALCLVEQPELGAGGFWTPAAIAGAPLIDRLRRHAGVSFE